MPRPHKRMTYYNKYDPKYLQKRNQQILVFHKILAHNYFKSTFFIAFK